MDLTRRWRSEISQQMWWREEWRGRGRKKEGRKGGHRQKNLEEKKTMMKGGGGQQGRCLVMGLAADLVDAVTEGVVDIEGLDDLLKEVIDDAIDGGFGEQAFACEEDNTTGEEEEAGREGERQDLFGEGVGLRLRTRREVRGVREERLSQWERFLRTRWVML